MSSQSSLFFGYYNSHIKYDYELHHGFHIKCEYVLVYLLIHLTCSEWKIPFYPGSLQGKLSRDVSSSISAAPALP